MYQNEVPVELNKVYFSDTIDFFLLHNTEEEHHVCSVDHLDVHYCLVSVFKE